MESSDLGVLEIIPKSRDIKVPNKAHELVCALNRFIVQMKYEGSRV